MEGRGIWTKIFKHKSAIGSLPKDLTFFNKVHQNLLNIIQIRVLLFRHGNNHLQLLELFIRGIAVTDFFSPLASGLELIDELI